MVESHKVDEIHHTNKIDDNYLFLYTNHKAHNCCRPIRVAEIYSYFHLLVFHQGTLHNWFFKACYNCCFSMYSFSLITLVLPVKRMPFLTDDSAQFKIQVSTCSSYKKYTNAKPHIATGWIPVARCVPFQVIGNLCINIKSNNNNIMIEH